MSEYMEARQSTEAYCEGDTETLSAFLPPFKFFRVDRLLWCSPRPLPPRLPIAFQSLAEAFGPCLQARVILQDKMSVPFKGGIGVMQTSVSCFSADIGCLDSTTGIPNRAARALRFSSSESSTAVTTAGFIDAGFGGGAWSWKPDSVGHSGGQGSVVPGPSWARRVYW